MLDRVHPHAAQREAFRADVINGLSRTPKTLPSRWLYDDRGSELFEQITRLPEYYPTRTETAILTGHAAALADFAGEGATLVEYGAGAGVKTEILLAALDRPAAYVPVDIAGDFLFAAAARIESRFPSLDVRPVVADFTDDFDLPDDLPQAGRRVGFFPGSTIGNLSTSEAVSFLKQVRRHAGEGGRAIIGADLKKALPVLLDAYDDAAGVTAAFDLNLLARANRELGATFDLAGFVHQARWNEAVSAVEMHLSSRRQQTVTVDGRSFDFAQGETIHTESSRKYSVDAFATLADRAGWSVTARWLDDDGLFAVFGLERA